jgi:hypothetical protein
VRIARDGGASSPGSLTMQCSCPFEGLRITSISARYNEGIIVVSAKSWASINRTTLIVKSGLWKVKMIASSSSSSSLRNRVCVLCLF